MSINVNVGGNTDPLVRDVNAAIERINRSGRLKIRIDDKGVTQPLGNMRRSADEFTKSLEASNARVLAFGASVGVINAVAGAFKGLVAATMEVQKNLTDINVVMGLSSQQLDRFGGGLMKVAAETGAGFKVASEAATEFARQGLSVSETLKRTKDALILTRLTGMKATESVKSLTAALNTFKGEIADSTALVSKFAAVDVKFAVSAEDFAQAISRAGQSARSAGVDINQLIGLVTAAQERTARGGAVIGNAFKTIFTRVRRSSTLSELENLGIAVRDLQGKTLPAMKIMQSLANTYDTLTDAQRAYISQNVAGVFQINILKAAMADLGKANSVTSQATAIAASATDESNKKNEQLRQTMTALATETGVAIQELAKKIGDIALAPGISKVLDGVKGMADGIGGVLGDGEQEGNRFATGLLRGVGNILTGPGLVMFAAVAGKLFVNAVKYAQQSLGSLLNINKSANTRRNIEQSLMQVLTTNMGLQKEMLRTDISREAKERTILQLIQQQTQEASRLAALTKSMAPIMMKAGIGAGLSAASSRTITASGFVPNYAAADDERAEARKGGYAPGAVRTMKMPGVGSVVYNTAEKVKKFPGMTQPAIMPPSGKAKDNYSKSFYGAHGFDPYAAGGYVPNFAIKIASKKWSKTNAMSVYNNKSGKRSAADVADAEKWLVEKGHLSAYNTRSSAVTTPQVGMLPGYSEGGNPLEMRKKGNRGNPVIDARNYATMLLPTVSPDSVVKVPVNTPGVTKGMQGYNAPERLKDLTRSGKLQKRTMGKGGSQAYQSTSAPGTAIYGKQMQRSVMYNVMGLDPESVSSGNRKGIGWSAKTIMNHLATEGYSTLGAKLGNSLELGNLQKISGGTLKTAMSKPESGGWGALNAMAGSVFEAALNSRLKIKGGAAKYGGPKGNTPMGGDFDVRPGNNNALLNGLFGGAVAPLADYKNAPSEDNRQSFAKKILQEMVHKRDPRLSHATKGLTLDHEGGNATLRAGGFVPNYADPLSDAIGRERGAGVPVSQIRVGMHNKLVGKSNPAGLGVTNTKDEPNGLRDVLGATGIVPNYSMAGAAVEFVDPQKKVDRLGKEAEEAAEEVSKYKDEIVEATKAKEEGTAEEKKLKKEVARLSKEEKAYANEVGKKKKGSTRHEAVEKKLTQASDALKAQRQTNRKATKKNTDATDALSKAEKKSAQASKKTQKAQASQQRRGMLGMTAMMGAQMAVGQMQGMDGFETSKSMQGIAGGVGMASTGASMGMMFGPWGTAVGALAGGVYGVLDGFNKAEEAARKLAKAQVVAREAAEAAEFSRKSGLAAGLLSQENISSLSDRWKGSDTLGGSTERKFTDPVVFTEKYFKAWNALALEGDTELKARNLGRKGDAAQDWRDTRGQRLSDDLGIKDGGFTPITRTGPKRGDIKGDGTFESRKRLAGSDQMVVEFTGNEEFTDDSAPTDYKEKMGVTFAQFRAMKMPGGAMDKTPEEQRIWQRMQQDSGGFSATQMEDVLGADWRGGPNANRLSMIASLGGSRVGANPMLAEELHKGAESGGGAGLLYEAAKEALKGEGQNTEGAVRKKYQDALVSWIEASVDPSSAPKEYDTTSWIKSGKKGSKGKEISQSEYAALDTKEKTGDTWSKVDGKKTLGFAELVAMAGSDKTKLSQLMELANQMETASMQGGVAKMTGDKQSTFIARKQDAHHRVDVNVMSKTQALADATQKYTQRVDKTRAIWDGLTSETSKVWRDYNMGMRKAGDKHTTTILKAESERKKGLLSIALEDRGEQRTNLMGALGIESTGDTTLEDTELLRSMEALSAQELHEILNKIIKNDSKRVGVMRDLENKQKLITKGAHNSLDASGKQLENSKEINLVLQTRLQLKTRMKRFDENTALKEEVELLKQAVALTRKMGEGNIALARMQGGTASQRYGVGQKNRKLQYENSVESSKVRHGKDLLGTIKSQPELRGIVDSDVGFDINEYQKLESSQAKADYLMGFKGKLKKKMIQDEADSYAAKRAPLSGRAANLEGGLKLLPKYTGGRVTMKADPRTGKSLDQLAVGGGGQAQIPFFPGMAGVNTLTSNAKWKDQMWEGGLSGQGGKVITTTQKEAMDKMARDRRKDWDDSKGEYTPTVTPDGIKGAHQGGWTYKGRMAPQGGSMHPDRNDFNMWEKGFTGEESKLFKEARILPSKRGGDVAKMAASYKAQDHVLDIDATRKNLENEQKINAEKLKNLDTTNKQVAAHSNVDEGLTQVIEKLRLKGDMHKEVLARMEAEYEIAKKLAEIEHKEKRGEGAFGRGMNKGMNQIQDRVETFSHTMGEAIPEMFSSGMSNAMMSAIRNGGKLKDVLRDAALGFLDTFNQKMMGHFADQATMALFGSGEQRTTKGYAKGGLVGFANGGSSGGGPSMVSNQEYVMGRDAVENYGPGMMDAVNSGHFQRKAGGGVSMAAGLGGLGGIAGGYLASKLFGKKEEDKHVVREKDRFETDGAWKRQNMSAHYMQNNERVQSHVGELRSQDQENTQKFIEKAEKKAQMGRQIFSAVASLGAQKLGAKLESSGAFGKADMAMGFGKDVEMPDGTLAKVSPDGRVFKISGASAEAANERGGYAAAGFGPDDSMGYKQASGLFGGKKDYGYINRTDMKDYSKRMGGKKGGWMHKDGSFDFDPATKDYMGKGPGKFASRMKKMGAGISDWSQRPGMGSKILGGAKDAGSDLLSWLSQLNPLKKATGGKIVGQSGIDQIPAMLSEGEYVIRADAARKMGVPALDKINSGRFNKGGVVTNATSDPGGDLGGGASTNNVTITVNVDKSGGESKGDDKKSGDGDHDKMDKFSARIKDQVITVIKEESRPGGLLDDGG
jgi:TP901 family phage tail tape measure protein